MSIALFPDNLDIETVVIVAGGSSICGGPAWRQDKYLTDIIDLLDSDPQAVLFDCNGYLSSRRTADLEEMPNPKFGFAVDFGIEPHRIPLDAVVQRFLSLPNSWQVSWSARCAKDRAEHLGLTPQFIFGSNIRADALESQEAFQALVLDDPKAVYVEAGTLGLAITAIPGAARTVHIYGMDSLTLNSFSNLNHDDNLCEQTYTQSRAMIWRVLQYLKDRHKFCFHA